MTRKFLVLPIAIIAGFALAASASAAMPKIAAGDAHTCGLEESGVVKCFGLNLYGQLGNTSGNGMATPNPSPTPVDLGAAATDIATGENHTCAALSGGSVKCFGFNYYGQLGNATNNSSGNPNPTPTTVDVGAAAIQLAAGGRHTCVLLTGGTVKCFGLNETGQLGNATNNATITPNPSPTTVDLGAPATQVTTGYDHTCALLAGGTVKCFGFNNFGQLGNATNMGTGNPNPTPTTVDLGAAATYVSAGDYHTCALLTGGTVKCFGYNYNGQLGTATNSGTSDPIPTPTTVDLGAAAIQISAGSFHTCALLTGGTVKCFGANGSGQLGNTANNGSGDPNPTPTTVDLGAPATQSATGGNHTCVALTGGTVKCFGLNYAGQLGNATNIASGDANPTPTVVIGLDLSTTPPPASVVTAKFAKPKWKSRRQGRLKLKLSTKATIVGDGLGAAQCSGKVLASVKPSRRDGSGSGGSGQRGTGKSPRLFSLQYSGGQCFANVSRTIPARFTRRGVSLRISLILVDSPLLRVGRLNTRPKIR